MHYFRRPVKGLRLLFRRLSYDTAAAALLSLAIAVTAPARAMETARIFSQPAAEVERQLPQAHPSAYFIYAGRTWDEGRRDDAVFWFYLGQLRFRFHLAAHPSLEPIGDPALFASLVATIGPPINRYAATDLPNWKKQIARALQWDEATPNLFTSKQTFHKAWQEIRAGLVKLRDDLDKHAAADARAPAATGHPTPVASPPPSRPLPTPPPLTPMPSGWPALETRTTAAMLAGAYEAGFGSLLGPLFFPMAEARVNRATSFELGLIDDRHLRVRALRDEKVLAEKLLEITTEADAVVFTDVAKDREAGAALGEVTRRQRLRLNVAGDLVAQRDIYPSTPTTTPSTESDAPTYTLWRIAKRLLPPTPPAASVAPSPSPP